jgi:hypothetical protein
LGTALRSSSSAAGAAGCAGAVRPAVSACTSAGSSLSQARPTLKAPAMKPTANHTQPGVDLRERVSARRW